MNTIADIKKSLDDYKQINDGKIRSLEKSISEMRAIVAKLDDAPKNPPKTSMTRMA